MMKSDYDQLKEMFSQNRQRDLKSPLVACPLTLASIYSRAIKKTYLYSSQVDGGDGEVIYY